MKRNLLKAIGISFLIFVVLSWIIPVGTYSDGELTTNGIDAVGLFDLVGVPVSTILTFALYIVVFAVIGGLYGVMEKTGALTAWTDKITKKFEGKEKRFVIFTIIFFVILSSVTGLVLPLFVLVPLFGAVILALNYDKITALASTVGALLVGSIASTYGFNVTGYTKNILSLDMSNEIWAKVILLVLLTAILIFFVLKFSKRSTAVKAVAKAETKKEVKEAKKETKTEAKKEVKAETKKAAKGTTKKAATKKTTTKTKKASSKKNTASLAVAKDVKKVTAKKTVSTIPLIVIFVLMLIVSLVGMYNWYYSFDIEFFNDIHTAIMEVKIGDFAIFEHLLSGSNALGYWGNAEFVFMMIVAAAIIAWIYKLKLGEFVESFIAGVKKMLPTAIYAALASVILTILYQASYSGTGTLVDTIYAQTFGLSDDFNVIITGVASLIGSFFYNDLYYLLAGLTPYVMNFDADALSIVGLLIQSVAGVGMIIFPTSVILIAGLSYFDVKWTHWFKYIWKFALAVFLIILLICCILAVM